MKRFLSKGWPLLVFAALMLVVCFNLRRSVWHSFKDPGTVAMLKRFVAMKEAQANAATNNLAPEFQAMFKDAERGDWLTLSNSYQDLWARNLYWESLAYGGWHWHGYRGAVEDCISDAIKAMGGHWEPIPPTMHETPGHTITEVYGAFEGFVTGDEKYSTQFGREIIDSIPAGSIYFGGTAPGRFIVSAMCRSQPDGDPFFTLDQNSLPDESYVQYLREMYGKKIYLPTMADRDDCFNEFVTERQTPSTSGDDGDRSQNDIMRFNGMLAKIIFDKNPGCGVFIDEGYPISWMYPQLEPHGLIFKINRQPVDTLSDEILQHDHDFWTSQIRPMIGGWLTDQTSFQEIAAFADKTFGRGDFSGFGGDKNFVKNAYASRMFSRSRSSIGGLYAWRARHAKDEPEKMRMTRAADFAFRQAWALCPYEPETCFNYLNFLLEQNRYDDALLLAETTASLPQNKGNELMAQTVAQVRQQWQKSHASAPAK